MKKHVYLLFFTVITLCSLKSEASIKIGLWRAEVQTVAGKLPFNFELKKVGENYKVIVLNGAERLEMDEAYIKNDSLHIPMELFDAEIVAKVEETKMKGVLRRKTGALALKEAAFTAEYGQTHRFIPSVSSTKINVNGKWETRFLTASSTYESVGVFQQKGNEVTGTFLTNTGDYRYLQGNIVGDSLKLSCFDGNHVFLFTAKVQGDSLTGGTFCAAFTYTEKWEAKRNEKAALPDASTLTHLKEGYSTIDFIFNNEKGDVVSLQDVRYKNKVVIVQILGSWCPNCMDETKFLVPFYEKNKGKGVEIICLAYEKSTDTAFAYPKIRKLKERFGVNYEILLAGRNDKVEAAKSLPMLDHVLAFPTMIVLDKKHQVREIHTGFSGPGTGSYYDEFVNHFTKLTDKLLAE